MTDRAQIVEKAKELGKLIADSEQVKELAKAKLAYDESAEMQDLNGQFNLHKMSISVLSKEDEPNEEKIAEHEQQLREIYEKIMSNEIMTEYQKSSEAVEQLIGDVNSIINFYVTGESPSGCTGSCATCGGCSGK